jgi:PAS domain S-box-containing protein
MQFGGTFDDLWRHVRRLEARIRCSAPGTSSWPDDLNRLLVDILPDRVFVKDLQGRYVLFNQASSEYWSIPREQAIGRTDAEIHTPSIAETFSRSDRQVYETGEPVVVEECIDRGDGSPRVLSVIKVPLRSSTGELWGLMGISRDISDLRRFQETVHRRDAILEAVSSAAGRFLREGFKVPTLREVLRSLGSAADVSRVFVFMNKRRGDGALVTTLLAEWAAPGIRPQEGSPYMLDFPWEEGGMGRWAATMERGECIEGHVGDFPVSEQAVLNPQDIVSVVAAPIVVEGHWWGFIGFDECCREREWAAGEVEALKTAGSLVAAAVQHARARAELFQFRDDLQDLVNERTRELEEANDELSQEVETRKSTEEKLSRRAAELAALNRLGRKVNATLAHEMVAESAVEEIQKALMPDAAVFLLRRGRFLLPLSVSPRDGDFYKDSLSVRTVGQCLCGEAAAVGECVFSLDVLADPRCTCPQFKNGSFRSVACIPLVSEEEVLGILTMASRSERDFREEVDFIQAFSNQVSVGLRNALLYEQLQWHVKELQKGFHELQRAQEVREELEAQLRQIQKMEAIGTLAGGIAHEFNNLLQSVQGFAELMLLGKEEGSQDHQRLKAICRSAARGGELTQQLLTYSRKSETRLRPVDLNGEILEANRILQRTLPKMIDIRLELASELPRVMADPQQMEQVIINLALNARDAMPQGGTLAVRTEKWISSDEEEPAQPQLLSGEYVRLRVSDTGCGMESSTVGRIFDPFFTTKDVGKGTGLGLAIVYGIVQNHSGVITCASEPGQGTTFDIYLPVGSHEELQPQVEKDAEPAGGRETILLVDDEDFLRSLGEQVLGLYGYVVLTAADADEAIAIFEQGHERIDLVILDLIMPGKSGYQCMERLVEINPRARIIVASGYVEMEGWGSEQLSHARFIVRKPYEMRDLLRLIRKALDDNGESDPDGELSDAGRDMLQ